MKKVFTVSVGLVVLGLLGVGGYFVVNNSAPSGERQQGSVSEALDKLTPLRVPPEGWEVYTNKQYGFSLFYPEGQSIKEYREGGGAITISFQNTETFEGFQIFIVPYEQNEITEARFRQDVPSGVRNNEASVTLDGAAGVVFESEDVALGQTYEVWVLHFPFLFEITTLKGQEQLLQSVLNTWEFI